MNRRKPPNPFERWDKLLIRLAVVCGAVLIIAQALLYHDASRRYLSRVDRLEGDPVSWQTPLVADAPPAIGTGLPVINRLNFLRASRKVVIRMVEPAAAADVFALVDGERTADFSRGEVVLTVYDGDYIEIDTGSLAAMGRFVVAVPDGGLVSPVHGAVVEGRGGTVPVGKVKFKQ